jgi:T5SS/PEP-CTERM-associated repeat protein
MIPVDKNVGPDGADAEVSRSTDPRSTSRTLDEQSVHELLHDLRSPLSVISNWITMLGDPQLDPAQRREGLHAMSLCVQEMGAILEQWTRTR